MKRLWLLAALVCACGVGADATTIVVFRDEQAFYIGADSLRRREIGNEKTRLQICKISRYGDLYATSAGVANYAGGFSVEPYIMIAATSALPSLAMKLELLDERIVEPLTSLARRIRSDDSIAWKTYQRRGLVEVAFAGIEGGRPTVLQRIYSPVVSPGDQVEIRVLKCPSTDCASGGQIFLLGETQAALRKLGTQSPYPPSIRPQEVIRDLIGLEIREQPDYVGPPINILRVNSDRTSNWLQGGDVCKLAP